jgi:hypothetical protein
VLDAVLAAGVVANEVTLIVPLGLLLLTLAGLAWMLYGRLVASAHADPFPRGR